ncbi:MAG: DUF4288 domain-containing protein [Anaerolineae bacterium]|nr:DUF4288 domain-containing protein [Anaerolineae bacterium]
MDNLQQDRSPQIPMALLGRAEYGLESVKDIEELGERLINLDVYLYPVDEEQFFPLSPEQRTQAIQNWVENVYREIEKAVPLRKVKIEWRTRRKKSWGFECEILPVDLLTLMKQPHIRYLRIVSVDGLKPKKVRKNRKLEWYAVKARFICQVEGQTKGSLLYEDRILLLKAYNFEDVEKRAQKEFDAYAHSYLNGDQEVVRWQFEEVLDIYHTFIEKIDPAGMEVYSEFGRRRMRPEYEWHPLRDQEEKTE